MGGIALMIRPQVLQLEPVFEKSGKNLPLWTEGGVGAAVLGRSDAWIMTIKSTKFLFLSCKSLNIAKNVYTQKQVSA